MPDLDNVVLKNVIIPVYLVIESVVYHSLSLYYAIPYQKEKLRAGTIVVIVDNVSIT